MCSTISLTFSRLVELDVGYCSYIGISCGRVMSRYFTFADNKDEGNVTCRMMMMEMNDG